MSLFASIYSKPYLPERALTAMQACRTEHPHSRRLDFHPHVHFIVPAGALDTKHRLWWRKNGTWLFHEGNLAKVIRAKWFQAMKDEGLKVRATIPKDWVVDCEHVPKPCQAR